MNDQLQGMEFDESVGEYLRRHREASGKGLDEVARVTRISRRYLEAIETSSFDQLPDETFVRGFLRNYASELGLDTEEVLNRYLKMKKAAAAPAIKEVKQNTESSFFVGTTVGVSKMPGWGIATLLAFAGIVIVTLGVWLIARSINSVSEPIEVTEERVTGSEEAMNSPSETAGSSLIAPSVLTIKASDITRLLLRLDEAAAQEVVIDKNETKSFEVHRQIEIQNLDRDKVKLEYNGRPMEAASSTLKLFNQNMFSK